MMNPDFVRAHDDFTAKWEGGWSNHAADTGGATMFGVTWRVYDAWRRAMGRALQPVAKLTLDEAREIYESWYWGAIAALLPWPLSAAVYDVTVNSGVGNARRLLNQARAKCPNGSPLEQALAVCDARQAFYEAIVRNNPTQGVFLRGWLRRVNAQREWLRTNAQPLKPYQPQVIMIDKAGKERAWDGRPTVYGGVKVDDTLIDDLRGRFGAGGPYRLRGLKVWVRRSGDLVIERDG